MADSADHGETLHIRGRNSYFEGHNFEKQVGDFYRLMGYQVQERRGFEGREIDLFISQRIGDLDVHRAIEYKKGTVTAEHLDSFIAKLKLVKRIYPNSLGAIVSIGEFTPSVASHAASEGITLTRFQDLESAVIDGIGYCSALIAEIESNEIYRLERFIEPQISLENESPHPATSLIDAWLSEPTWSQLALLGGVGTGKSFITRHLAYRLCKTYLSDPVNNPFPVRIDLRDTDRHLSLEGLLLTHLAKTSLRNTRFDVFEHALFRGRIVLIFDGFDEMAARINPRTIIRNFYELTRAVTGQAKVLLTCRTHYFKSRTHEEQILLGETETPKTDEARELYWDVISRRGYKICYVRAVHFSRSRAVRS